MAFRCVRQKKTKGVIIRTISSRKIKGSEITLCHQPGGTSVNTSSRVVKPSPHSSLHSRTGWHLEMLEKSLEIRVVPEKNWERLVAPKPGGWNGSKLWNMLVTCSVPDIALIGYRHGPALTSFLSILKMAIDSW